MNRNTYRRRFPMFPLFFVVAALIMGGIVMWLWNAIIPYLFNVNPIRYWHAVGLLVLCRLLFGNFGGRMGGPGRWNNWQNNGEGAVNDKQTFDGPPWRGKWMNMTDEERKKFRDEMRRRCGKPPRTE